MAIEARTLANGVVIGFDTNRNSYCKLPDGWKEGISVGEDEISDGDSGEQIKHGEEQDETASKRGKTGRSS